MKNLDLLKKLCLTQPQDQVRALVISRSKKLKANVITNRGNVYITKGTAELYPCFTAHLDTVHKNRPDMQIFKYQSYLFAVNTDTMKQTGIGGDDRAGLFICLELLRTLENVKIVFFRDEEIGCKGSRQADKDFFNDCKFIGAADRKGSSDIIYKAAGTTLAGDDFIKDLKPIIKGKFKEASGMLTDVVTLKEDGVNLSMFNISTGYYYPHTDSEVIDMDDVETTFETLREIAALPKKYVHKYEKPKYSYNPHPTYYGRNYQPSEIALCRDCNTPLISAPAGGTFWTLKEYCPTCRMIVPYQNRKWVPNPELKAGYKPRTRYIDPDINDSYNTLESYAD